MNLSTRAFDPIEVLALTGGTRQTDNLEVFPKIVRQEDGSFSCRFFLHGFRHVSQPGQERLKALNEGDRLQLVIELNNPATGLAVQLQTTDYQMIGWAPRYFIHDFIHAIIEKPWEVSAFVVRVIPETVPLNNRFLIELRGHLPDNFEPMSSEEYSPLVN